MTLVPSDHRGERDVDTLRARAAEIERLIEERRATLAQARADLRLFEIDYRQRVGTLHEELDELEAAIAEAELGELAKDPEVDAAREDGGHARACRPENPPRFTSDAVRTLFRDVAKIIHPDLARDDASRARRHRLMVEANKAYVLGDEERLRSILEAWERSPESVPASDPDAVRLRLARRVAQLEEELELLDSAFAELKASPLFELKAMVGEAAERGKDLMGDMIVRLQRDIMVARNRLDAMRPPEPPATI